MEYKIINTGDYLLIVDDSEIKEGNKVYWIDPDNGLSSQINTAIEIYEDLIFMSEINASEIEAYPHEVKKIIAHLPLNNSPILEGVDLLPPLEDEVEKKLNENCNPKIAAIMIKGYNKAKEKYKYTEEDLKDIWKYVKNNRVTYEEYLQSLQQPKIPIGFKKSVEILNVSLNEKNISFPAKTTNSQGITQWVGEYIY